MSKSVSIALGVVWGVLAVIVGSGFLYSYLFVARAEITSSALVASAYENQTLDEIEQGLSAGQFLQEFNQYGPIVGTSSSDASLDPVSSTRPIRTTLPFERGTCPQSGILTPPVYTLRVDKETSIGNHIPSFLVNITGLLPTKDGRHICLDETTALYLADLLDAARADGYTMTITSGYRSFATQSVLFDRAIERHGYEVAHTRVAPPGHSEHQLGTTVDLAAATNGFISAGAAFGTSPEYAWMLEHAASFGFVLSYPEGHEEETGYVFEPWHWRFVGVDDVEKFQIQEENELLN